MNTPLQTTLAQRSTEAVQGRFARRLTAALDELHAKSAHPDVDTRLRFAHDQALAAARKSRGAITAGAAPTIAGLAGGAAILGSGPGAYSPPWWLRLSSLLPLAVLLAGLVLIDSHYTRSQIDAAAEVDAAILADDLPPEAYRDQGFVEFLKTARP